MFHALLTAGKREVRFERAVVSSLGTTLGRSVRTVQRHLHLLRELGLVEFVERRRWRGRYSGYTYRVLHVVQLIRRKKKGSPTTGHEGP